MAMHRIQQSLLSVAWTLEVLKSSYSRQDQDHSTFGGESTVPSTCKRQAFQSLALLYQTGS